MGGTPFCTAAEDGVVDDVFEELLEVELFLEGCDFDADDRFGVDDLSVSLPWGRELLFLVFFFLAFDGFLVFSVSSPESSEAAPAPPLEIANVYETLLSLSALCCVDIIGCCHVSCPEPLATQPPWSLVDRSEDLTIDPDGTD